MRLGDLSGHLRNDGTVRDGTPQHFVSSCGNHGGCKWCESNRTFANKRRTCTDD